MSSVTGGAPSNDQLIQAIKQLEGTAYEEKMTKAGKEYKVIKKNSMTSDQAKELTAKLKKVAENIQTVMAKASDENREKDLLDTLADLISDAKNISRNNPGAFKKGELENIQSASKLLQNAVALFNKEYRSKDAWSGIPLRQEPMVSLPVQPAKQEITLNLQKKLFEETVDQSELKEEQGTKTAEAKEKESLPIKEALHENLVKKNRKNGEMILSKFEALRSKYRHDFDFEKVKSDLAQIIEDQATKVPPGKFLSSVKSEFIENVANTAQFEKAVLTEFAQELFSIRKLRRSFFPV